MIEVSLDNSRRLAMRRTYRFFHTAVVLTLATLAACAKEKPAADTTAARSGATTAAATAAKLGETGGFKTPESVRYDPELDVYYISNISGNPSQKDNNGFISKVRADSTGVVTM